MASAVSFQIRTEQAIRFFLIAGVFTLIFWKGSIKENFIPKPSELFFGLALASGLFYLIFFDRFAELKKIRKDVLFTIFLLISSMAIAMLYGYFRYDLPLITAKGISYLLRFGAGIGLFSLATIFLKKDSVFIKKLYAAFALPPLIYVAFVFVFAVKYQFPDFFGVNPYRFTGFASLSTFTALLTFISFVFVICFLLPIVFSREVKKNVILLFIGAMALTGFSAIITWTSSRSYFGAMWFSAVLGSVVMGLYYKRNIARTGIVILAVVSLLLWGIALIPIESRTSFFSFFKHSIELRFLSTWPVVNNAVKQINDPHKFYSEFVLDEAAKKLVIGSSPTAAPVSESVVASDQNVVVVADTDNEPDTTYYQRVFGYKTGRLLGIAYYLDFFSKDTFSFIFGLGLNYEQKFSLIWDPGWAQGGAHGANSGLDVFLYGGIGEFIGIFILGYLVFRNIRSKFISGASKNLVIIYSLAPALALFGLVPGGIFAGLAAHLFGFYFWILLAMALAESPKEQIPQDYTLKGA